MTKLIRAVDMKFGQAVNRAQSTTDHSKVSNRNGLDYKVFQPQCNKSHQFSDEKRLQITVARSKCQVRSARAVNTAQSTTAHGDRNS